MRRKKREPQSSGLQVQQSKIIFDDSQMVGDKCRICSKTGEDLISPCECLSKTHQKCLLLYIKRVIKRGQRITEEMDLSSIKCRSCEHQYHVIYKYESEYNCGVFCRRMERNCCNKHVTIITLLIIVIIITVVVFINLVSASHAKNVIYALIGLLVVEGLILLIIFSHFIQTYLLLKQLILERCIDIFDMGSIISSNSDENKISDDCDVVVRD